MSKFKHHETIRNADTLLSVSLNGIDSAYAQTMIAYFLNNKKNDLGPIQETIWFDSVTIRHIYELLKSERDDEKPDKDSLGFTDGFRVYFGSNPNVNKRHLKNSIIIVSTKKSGYDPTVPSKSTHCDYYYHSKKASLFSNPDLTTINGLVKRRQWINTRGENLYNIYFNSKDNISCGDPHYIFRGKAYKMVNQFGKTLQKTKDTITTKSEWFDFNLLKAFVEDKHPHDGLRIYFSRHPAKYNNQCDTDSNREAFILIPTHRVKFIFWTYHNDYFDCTSTESYFQYFLSNKRIADWYKQHPKVTGGGGGADNGELCQPHCQ